MLKSEALQRLLVFYSLMYSKLSHRNLHSLGIDTSDPLDVLVSVHVHSCFFIAWLLWGAGVYRETVRERV